MPTWGAATFAGMGAEPSPGIMNNSLEQLREMIVRDRHLPCIFSWGVCNEINGQNPPAYAFARRMYEEAKRLDPRRLVSYASNSLEKTPEKDVAGRMDYIMWNEYYGSWYAGTPADMGRNLDQIHCAFPDKQIVISEYGYCACTPAARKAMPGASGHAELRFTQPGISRIQVDIMRPTGFSAWTEIWQY